MHFCKETGKLFTNVQGVTRGHNSPGAESLRRAPKSPDKVTSKNLRFEHWGAKLASCPESI